MLKYGVAGLLAGVLALSALAAARAGEGGVILAKMAINSMSAADQKTLWTRVEDYAKADSLLEFCGKRLNLYKRTWNAVSPCVETASLRKVGAVFRAKKGKYLEILGGNYPDEEKKKAFCGGLDKELKTYTSIIEAHLSEARGMCSACLFC